MSTGHHPQAMLKNNQKVRDVFVLQILRQLVEIVLQLPKLLVKNHVGRFVQYRGWHGERIHSAK